MMGSMWNFGAIYGILDRTADKGLQQHCYMHKDLHEQAIDTWDIQHYSDSD